MCPAGDLVALYRIPGGRCACWLSCQPCVQTHKLNVAGVAVSSIKCSSPVHHALLCGCFAIASDPRPLQVTFSRGGLSVGRRGGQAVPDPSIVRDRSVVGPEPRAVSHFGIDMEGLAVRASAGD